jgi:hypothetical protein
MRSFLFTADFPLTQVVAPSRPPAVAVALSQKAFC